MTKSIITKGFKILGGGRNALLDWVLENSLVEWLNSLKIKRLLSRIESCTALFCYAKNIKPSFQTSFGIYQSRQSLIKKWIDPETSSG